jgi:hypothetical protein
MAQAGSEEIIVDRRPSLDLDVNVVDKTQWMDADDATPVKGFNNVSIRCKIAEATTVDDYGYPVGEISVVILHQYFDAKRKKWSGDTASSEINPHAYISIRTQDGVIHGLKDRFKTCIKAYLDQLVREKRPIPLAFLADRVYPDAICCLMANGIRSVEKFAAIEDGEPMNVLMDAFRDADMTTWAHRVPEFRQKAREMLQNLGVRLSEAPEDEPRPVGRPRKAA